MCRDGGKADASDLKSGKPRGLCGFDSHSRHHMVKALSLLNLALLMYHGYVFARYTGNVPHETVIAIVNAVLLIGFVFTRRKDE